MRRALVVLGCLAVSAVARNSRADEPDPAGAEVLFDRALALWNAGQWEAACEQFDASFALDRAASTKVKLARCHLRQGRTASAWVAYREAKKLNETTDGPRREEIAALIASELAAIEAHVPQLVVRVAPPNAAVRVLRGATELPFASLGSELPVDPGPIVVAAGAPGYQPTRAVLTLADGDRKDVTLQLVPLPPESLDPPRPEGDARKRPLRSLLDAPHRPSDASPWPLAGAIALGAGAASLLVAGGFGVSTLAKVGESGSYCNAADRCSSRGVALRDEARDAQTAAIALGAAGIAVGGAGVVVLVTRSASDEPAASSDRYVGISWTGRTF